MRSRTTVKFREAFAKLPQDIQEQARKSYRQFKQDPWYPALHFKKIHGGISIYSVRVGSGYRAVRQKTKDAIVWFWIGSHEEYNNLLSQTSGLHRILSGQVGSYPHCRIGEMP